MTFFQIILIFSAISFFVLALKFIKHQKINFFQFMIYGFGSLIILFFAFYPDWLGKLGNVFGIKYGSWVIVYLSIISLFYFVFLILNKHTQQKFKFISLVSNLAIKNLADQSCFKKKLEKIQNQDFKDEFIFAVRVYNESKTVGKVIDEILSEGFRKIVLVNDGSSDESEEIINQKIRENQEKFIFLLSHLTNCGGGTANQTLFKFVSKFDKDLKIKRVVTFDADDQMEIKDIYKFMDLIKQKKSKGEQIDVIFGSRFVEGANMINVPISRKIILKISKLVTWIFYGIWHSDPHAGFRVFFITALKQLKITAWNMHYANQINEQVKKLNLKYDFVPISVKYTDYSLQKGQKNWNSIKLGLEMIYRKLFE